ncbi:hypothetical protein IP88_07715 [alpha proteobacterium AAP81b]|nr:hypothetical protein IP88_07715 [alpha proteobacterium AAP81b]
MILLLLLLAAAPAAAPPVTPDGPMSACAALAEKGDVAAPATAVLFAEPTPERGWRCPDDYRLDLKRRLPSCVGGIATAPGNPRAICYSRLMVGPIAPLPERSRPTASCWQRTRTAIIELRGAGLGWRDVAVTVRPADDITVLTLAPAPGGKAANPAENPNARNCFADTCRLVKLTIGSGAAPEVTITARAPGGEPATASLKLRAWCPRPER